MQPLTVSAFYRFFPVEETEELRHALEERGEALGLHGLVLVAPEGINGTVSGTPEAVEQWKECIRSCAPDIRFKDSPAEEHPFKRLSVKVRSEIVALGDTSVVPDGPNNHLSPQEWDAMMEQEDVVVLDTRNTYETAIGTFDTAADPQLEKFSDFPAYVKQCGIPRDRKVLMYCTGGIRCEKASLEMQRQGYTQVYQLDGGILRYLEERTQGRFRGECFVFDHRAAVGAGLRPSQRYRLCPHCGDPGDRPVTCGHCGGQALICGRCRTHTDACSKDCRHRLGLATRA